MSPSSQKAEHGGRRKSDPPVGYFVGIAITRHQDIMTVDCSGEDVSVLSDKMPNEIFVFQLREGGVSVPQAAYRSRGNSGLTVVKMV